MNVKPKQQLHTLIKKYNIHFDGEIDEDKWPINHKVTFGNIKRLGETDLREYRDIVTIEVDKKPWREQTRRRAERIAELANFCRDGRKNEAGWRMSLESEILARFTIEVACRKCRARLWRSELEAPAGLLGWISDSLEKRQKRRSPCNCRPRLRGEDPIEQGVNPLFDDRTQETIIQEAELQAQMPKREQPDRVYGLRMTKRLERLLLWTEDKRPTSGSRPIGECIKTSPFRHDREPIIFPFFALEAKSEKGRDGFSGVEMQTAFTIRALLKLQEDLRKATGEESQWESGPLVWFLAYKGEQWRVAAAYVEYEGRVQHFRVVDLWDGRITSNEGALRLLLIVDYIFDWARDIYREAIIGELRTLSGSNNTSLGNDSDIFSIVDRVAFWPQGTDTDAIIGPYEAEVMNTTGIQDRLQAFDSPHGVVRNGRYIQSRLTALHITEDNLYLLIQSMQTPEKAREAAGTILKCLKDCWRVTAEALDRIELMWTGKDRENANLYSPDKVFFVVVTIAAYLSPTWEQTRELCYLAVSEAVIDALIEHAALKNSKKWDPSDFPYIESDKLVRKFEAFRSMTIQDNLIAAISRACLSTTLYVEKPRNQSGPDVIWVKSKEKSGNAMYRNSVKYRFDAAIMADRQAHTREFVSSIYNLHKIGRNEPSTSILRISTRLDDQEPNPPQTNNLWPRSKDLGYLEQKRLFFIVSKNPNNVSHYAELCVFLKDESALEEIYQAHPSLSPNLQWHFQSRRLDSKPGWGRGWNNADIKVRDENFPQMFTSFYSHLEKSALFSSQKTQQVSEHQSSPEVWKPKRRNTDFVLSTNEQMRYLDIMDYWNMLTAKGSRVRSITNHYLSQTNRDPYKISPSRKGKAVDRATSLLITPAPITQDIERLAPTIPAHCALEDIPNLIGWAKRSDRQEPQAKDTNPVSTNRNPEPSKTAQNNDKLRDIIDITNDPVTPRQRDNQITSFRLGDIAPVLVTHDPSTTPESTPKKRVYSRQGVEEEEGEPSSRNSKRSRTDIGEEFARDYLDQDELDQLISDGYFT